MAAARGRASNSPVAKLCRAHHNRAGHVLAWARLGGMGHHGPPFPHCKQHPQHPTGSHCGPSKLLVVRQMHRPRFKGAGRAKREGHTCSCFRVDAQAVVFLLCTDVLTELLDQFTGALHIFLDRVTTLPHTGVANEYIARGNACEQHYKTAILPSQSSEAGTVPCRASPRGGKAGPLPRPWRRSWRR